MALKASDRGAELRRLFDTPSAQRPKTACRGDLIAKAYNNLRCRVDPSFSPPDSSQHFAKAEQALKKAGIPETRWSGYLEYLFDVFPKMTNGTVYFAPLNRLASEGLIDSYKATLPPLRLNIGRARQFLYASGYQGSITAAVHVFEALRKGEAVPNYSEAARCAGKLLHERAADIGFVEEPNV